MARLAFLYIFILWALSWSVRTVRAQGITICRGTTLDWYTSVVGETPCATYQRLRQICNSAYTVGPFPPLTPPDHCDEQLSSCCCNSISFALSMLCLNCQQGVGSGVNGDYGFDAGPGAYGVYLHKSNGELCSPNVNQSFPSDIQSAVCNNKIKIDDALYVLFWVTGNWFYEYTRQTLTKTHAQFANNTFTHCASTTISNTTSSVASSTNPTSTSSAVVKASSPPVGGIVAGATIGAVVFLLVVGLVLWFLRRRRRLSKETFGPAIDEYIATPFVPPAGDSTHLTQPNYPGISTGYSRSGSESGPRSSQKGAPPSGHPSRQAETDVLLSNASPSLLQERHVDGGAVVLSRSPSGRLPPAYGEQLPS